MWRLAIRLSGLCCMSESPSPRFSDLVQAVNGGPGSPILERTAELQSALSDNTRLVAAINSAATGVLLCDPTQTDTPIVFVNQAFCTITGYPREEIIGKNCRFLQGKDTDPAVVAQIRAAQAEQRPFRGTLLNYRKDGTPFWNGLTINPVFSDSGDLVNFVGVQVDLTVRVEELERVRQSEAQLALAQRVAHLGSWGQTFTNGPEPAATRLDWSNETFRIFGHAPEASVNAWALFENGVHPDDRAAVHAAYSEALRTRQGYCLDHRIVRPDGVERIVHEEADLIFDERTGRLSQVVGTVQDITERKRTETDTVHLAALVESSEDAIIGKTLEGIITSWNRGAVALYGHTEAEAVGQSCLRLLIPAERQDEALYVLRKLARGERVPPFETVRLRKGNLPIHISLSMSPIINADGTVVAISSISRDITERKQAEAARTQLAAIVDSSADAIVGEDLQGNVTSWNNAAERIFGYSAQEMVGHSILPLIPWNCHVEEERFLSSVRRGESVDHFDTARLTKAGRMIDVSLTVSPIKDATGRIIGASKIARDITERRQAQENQRAKEEAERANLAKSEFLSRMSHELRTPLNAILGFGQLLELSRLGEHDAQSVSYILKGGRHLLSLVDEVLDLARVEAGEVLLTFSAVSLDRISQECIGLIARAAQARGITCAVEMCPACPMHVRADEQRLRQVLLNLLSNAIKYNREGGQVTLSCEQAPNGRVRLSVRDTGPGISPEGVARLFVPFERLGQEHGEVEGTGLGLAVSRRMAEAMEGRVGAESQEGEGSTFWVELPGATCSVAAEAVGAGAPMLPVLAVEDSSRATLLYIEDNSSNLQVVKMVLGRMRPRWRVLSARDGENGLQQARDTLPNLILLDLQLPGMNGDAVLAELRGDASTRCIPVLLLSADATTKSRERLLALGADDYLPKPYIIATLLNRVDALLRNSDG